MEWLEAARLVPGDRVRLEGGPLTVVIWAALKTDAGERRAAA